MRCFMSIVVYVSRQFEQETNTISALIYQYEFPILELNNENEKLELENSLVKSYNESLKETGRQLPCRNIEMGGDTITPRPSTRCMTNSDQLKEYHYISHILQCLYCFVDTNVENLTQMSLSRTKLFLACKCTSSRAGRDLLQAHLKTINQIKPDRRS